MEIIKVFQLTDTFNNKVNIEKLSLELKTSTITEEAIPSRFGSEIFVRFQNEITPGEITLLQNIVAAHDGGAAETTEELVSLREIKIRELTQMSFYHPLLDNDKTTEYLTSIDNYINAYIRSGNYNILISKIGQDGVDGSHPNYDYLNIVVSTSGHKTFEYFIGKIME